MSEAQRPMTFGEKAVGLTFNPGANEMVQIIKQQFAIVIDTLHAQREDAASKGNDEAVRMLSISITDAQTAQMWAVKAVTWQY